MRVDFAPLFPGRCAEVLLFEGVSGGAALGARLAAGELGPDVAVMSAAALASAEQLLAAATAALGAEARGKMVARTLAAELAFRAMPSKNLSRALAAAALSDDTPRAVAVVWGADAAAVAAVREAVGGSEAALEALSAEGREEELRRLWKLTAAEVALTGVEDCVLRATAVKTHI